MRLLFNATNLRSEGGVILLERLLGEFLAYRPQQKSTEQPELQNNDHGGKISRLLLYHNPELSARIAAMLATYPAEDQSRIELVPLREPDGWRRFCWEQISLPRIIQREKIDTLFSFGNTGPVFPGCRQILYLQQSIPYSNFLPARQKLKWLKFKWLYGFLINLAQLGSGRMIVPTSWLVEPMRRAIAYCKPLSAYRVSLPGLPPWPNEDARAFNAQEQALLHQLAQWREQGQKILLYPCFLAPYKNIPALLEAVRLLDDSVPPFKLVMTFNANSPEYFPCKSEVLEAVNRCNRDRVILAGALNRPTLARVYRQTDLLLFPSLVETLGLPLLEAMSQGIPIVALDGALNETSSTSQSTQAAFAREICRETALYAPVHDAKMLAHQIERLLTDPALATQLSEQGMQRAAELSWAQHVEEILRP